MHTGAVDLSGLDVQDLDDRGDIEIPTASGNLIAEGLVRIDPIGYRCRNRTIFKAHPQVGQLIDDKVHAAEKLRAATAGKSQRALVQREVRVCQYRLPIAPLPADVAASGAVDHIAEIERVREQFTADSRAKRWRRGWR